MLDPSKFADDVVVQIKKKKAPTPPSDDSGDDDQSEPESETEDKGDDGADGKLAINAINLGDGDSLEQLICKIVEKHLGKYGR